MRNWKLLFNTRSSADSLPVSFNEELKAIWWVTTPATWRVSFNEELKVGLVKCAFYRPPQVSFNEELKGEKTWQKKPFRVLGIL